jgi:hypothetical protein
MEAVSISGLLVEVLRPLVSIYLGKDSQALPLIVMLLR